MPEYRVHKIEVRAPSGAILPATIRWSIDPVEMCIIIGGQPELVVRASTLFECFIQLRLTLEPEGIRFLCNGARLDAYPSAMSLSMGSGWLVYQHREGQTGSVAGGLNLLDPSPIECVGTVEEQREWHKRWIQSIQKSPRIE